eukprot:TRINITY_DN9218_c0_g1_i5.p3 TRINITY_DN9218_c0_g1~~TRINITY_DN9218_c0_g1_i5.p3  ORF type:complete len:112 (-),score=21.30 TRINITY_DN9218_c0_g1_i5:793-1128(-)
MKDVKKHFTNSNFTDLSSKRNQQEVSVWSVDTFTEKYFRNHCELKSVLRGRQQRWQGNKIGCDSIVGFFLRPEVLEDMEHVEREKNVKRMKTKDDEAHYNNLEEQKKKSKW